MAGIELWGPGELIEAVGITYMTLKRWRQRPDFPKPLAELKMGPVWLASDVKHWKDYFDRGWLSPCSPLYLDTKRREAQRARREPPVSGALSVP